MNIVILKGNVGKDPEIKSTQNGEFATFTLATSKKWKDKNTGELKEKTEWHDILTNSVNQAKYIEKGMALAIQGELKYSRRDDKFFTTILAKNIEFCGSGSGKKKDQGYKDPLEEAFEGEGKKNQGVDFKKARETSGQDQSPEGKEDDLPF